jgi:hypothetical protein
VRKRVTIERSVRNNPYAPVGRANFWTLSSKYLSAYLTIDHVFLDGVPRLKQAI